MPRPSFSASALYRLQDHVALTRTEAKTLLVVALLFAVGLVSQHYRTPAPVEPPAGHVAQQESAARPAPVPATDSTATEAPATEAPATEAPACVANVNTASAAELDRLPGVGPATAAKIIGARPFSDALDLRRVRGIGPAKSAKLAPLVCF